MAAERQEVSIWMCNSDRPEDGRWIEVGFLSVDKNSDASAGLSEKLRDAIAEVAADRSESVVWTSAYLPTDRALALVANLPETVRKTAAEPVGRVADAAGLPAPGDALVAEVAASFALGSVLKPVTAGLHRLEIACVVVGLLTGQPHLAIIAAKPLLHDELGEVLADKVEQLMTAKSEVTTFDAPVKPWSSEALAARGNGRSLDLEGPAVRQEEADNSGDGRWLASARSAEPLPPVRSARPSACDERPPRSARDTGR